MSIWDSNVSEFSTGLELVHTFGYDTVTPIDSADFLQQRRYYPRSRLDNHFGSPIGPRRRLRAQSHPRLRTAYELRPANSWLGSLSHHRPRKASQLFTDPSLWLIRVDTPRYPSTIQYGWQGAPSQSALATRYTFSVDSSIAILPRHRRLPRQKVLSSIPTSPKTFSSSLRTIMDLCGIIIRQYWRIAFCGVSSLVAGESLLTEL